MCGKNKTQGDSAMSVETEVKAVEQAVVAEATKVETEVKTVAEAVVADVKAEVAKVEKVEKAAVVNIKAEEQLVLRNAELEFLKAQMEIQRLSKITEAKSKEYTTYVEGLFKTYVLDRAEYVFDGAINAFKKL